MLAEDKKFQNIDMTEIARNPNAPMNQFSSTTAPLRKLEKMETSAKPNKPRGLMSPLCALHYDHCIFLCWCWTGGHTCNSYFPCHGKPSGIQWGIGVILSADLGTTQVPVTPPLSPDTYFMPF